MAEYTRFTNLEATGEVKASVIKGILSGVLQGVSLSKSGNYTLTDSEKVAYIGITLSAASKTLTLDLPNNAVCIDVNEGGSNAFTVKNVSGDTGTSVAAGKCAIVVASTTADGSTVAVLN